MNAFCWSTAAKLLVHIARVSAGYGHQIPQILQKNYGFSSEAAQWATGELVRGLRSRSTLQPNTSRNGSHAATIRTPPQLALRRLLTDYGPVLLEDPARVHALLADLSGSSSRERFLLVYALREHIPAELLVQHSDDTDQMQQLSQRFQRRYGFSTEAARWAIETWSLTLEGRPFRTGPCAKRRSGKKRKQTLDQLTRARDAARETARQKTIERAAAETVVLQKTE